MPDSGGLSRDTIIGIAVGGAAALTIITALAILFIRALRRANQVNNGDDDEPDVVLPDFPLHFYFLGPLGDDEIAFAYKGMEVLIHDHVRTFYHLQNIDDDCELLKKSLEPTGLDESVRSHIAMLCQDPSTRRVGIRSLLARVIFTALDVYSIGHLSLLPRVVRESVQALPSTTISMSGQSPESPTGLFDLWRRCFVFLLHQNSPGAMYLAPLPRDSSEIEKLRGALESFLVRFVNEDDGAHEFSKRNYSKGLTGVIYQCALVGYSIFCQPCSWRYVFEAEHGMVVMPGLEIVTGPEGEVLESRRTVALPVIGNV